MGHGHRKRPAACRPNVRPRRGDDGFSRLQHSSQSGCRVRAQLQRDVAAGGGGWRWGEACVFVFVCVCLCVCVFALFVVACTCAFLPRVFQLWLRNSTIDDSLNIYLIYQNVTTYAAFNFETPVNKPQPRVDPKRRALGLGLRPP